MNNNKLQHYSNAWKTNSIFITNDTSVIIDIDRLMFGFPPP